MPASRSHSICLTTSDFDALHLRFMSLLSRLQVVTEILGNCENLSGELAPAGYVLNETTKEVEQLYDDLDVWHISTSTPRRRCKVMFLTDDGRQVLTG